jgi:hypothetical protein
MSNAQTSELTEARDLILRPALSYDARARLAALLRIHLADESIAEGNLFQVEADARFMSHYYPESGYRTSPIATGSLARYGHTIASAVRGDYASLATEALISAARHGVVDRVVSAFLPGSRTLLGGAHNRPAIEPRPPVSLIDNRAAMADEQAKKDAIKREIRLLTLSRNALQPADRSRLIGLLGAHHLKGAVTPDNYVFIALNFLRAYYPADFEAEKRRWKDRETALTAPTGKARTPGRGTLIPQRPPTSRTPGPEPPFVSPHAVAPMPFRLSTAMALTALQPASGSASGTGGQPPPTGGSDSQDSSPLPPSQPDEGSGTGETASE